MATTVSPAVAAYTADQGVDVIDITELTNVGVTLKTTAPNILWWRFDNSLSSEDTYFKAYDDATPDHAVDDPDLVVKIPAGAKGTLRCVRFDNGFITALGAAASLTAAIAGAVPSETLTVEVGLVG